LCIREKRREEREGEGKRTEIAATMGSNALEHVNAPDLPEALHTMLTPIDDAVGERLTVAVAVPAAAAGEGPGEETTATPMGTTMSGFQSQDDVDQRWGWRQRDVVREGECSECKLGHGENVVAEAEAGGGNYDDEREI
jgi:hypothetical protein